MSARDRLTAAIMIACEAHEGQTDKNGEPYILHPLRVMMAMETEDERIVAVLHDTAEDFVEGWARIHDGGFGDHILDAIDALTRNEGETYDNFIERCKANPLARRVKIADITDNLRPGAEHLRTRYIKARAILEERP